SIDATLGVDHRGANRDPLLDKAVVGSAVPVDQGLANEVKKSTGVRLGLVELAGLLGQPLAAEGGVHRMAPPSSPAQAFLVVLADKHVEHADRRGNLADRFETEINDGVADGGDLAGKTVIGGVRQR